MRNSDISSMPTATKRPIIDIFNSMGGDISPQHRAIPARALHENMSMETSDNTSKKSIFFFITNVFYDYIIS